MSKKAKVTILTSGIILALLFTFYIYSHRTITFRQDKVVSESNNEVKLTDEIKKDKGIRLKPDSIRNTIDDDFDVLKALDSNDFELQERAIQMIISEKLTYASEKLLQMLKGIPRGKIDNQLSLDENDLRIKSLAALALSEMKNKDALPIIIDLIGEAYFPAPYDETLLVLSAVNYGKDALSLIEDKIEEYGRRNPYGKMSLLSIIMNAEDKEAIPDLQDMFDDSKDPDIRSAAARGLRNLGETVEISKIVETLKDVDDNPRRGKQWLETRDNLVDELGFSGNPDAIPLLKRRIEKEMARDSWHPLIYGEIVALARISGQENYSYLQNIYDESKNYEIRRNIIMTFGESKMLHATDFLINLINDQKINKQLRLYGTDSLGHITGEKEKYMKMRWEIESDKR